jgi:hypothetical protein
MASTQSTLPVSAVLDNLDLVRRYCPSLAVHTHAQIAAHLHVDSHGCWPWDASICDDGYGAVSCKPTPYGYRQSVHVHRYMYDTLVGPIPEDHHIHHRCFYRACWNLFHLEPVTPKEHYARHHPVLKAVWQPPIQLTLAFMS